MGESEKIRVYEVRGILYDEEGLIERLRVTPRKAVVIWISEMTRSEFNSLEDVKE